MKEEIDRVAPPTATERKPHLLMLDALRGLAAGCVVFTHSEAVLGRQIAPSAYLAVDLFFVLSGFVISYAYDEQISTGLDFRRFSLIRLTRLWPTYIAGTALGYGLVLAQEAHRHDITGLIFNAVRFIANAAYIPTPTRHSPHLYPFDFPAWSLFFELAANAAYFPLARSTDRKGLVAVVAISAVAILGLGFLHNDINFGSRGPLAAWAFARVGYSFFAGALLHRLFRTPHARLVAPGIAVALIGLVLATLLIPVPSGVAAAHGLLCVLVLFPTVVFVASRVSIPDGWRRAAKVSADLSYPLYTLHIPLLTTFGVVYAHYFHRPTAPILALIPIWVAIGTVAYVWDRRVDVPVRRKLRRISRDAGSQIPLTPVAIMKQRNTL